MKYPDIKVQLTGNDGNAYAILANVGKALKRANVDAAEIASFKHEAMFGDYDHLLQTCMRWVTVG
ncbi:MAG: hypothetical protein HOG49_31755 [Candidatus Scalindua sp.]|nr:hypothetical protein [Candidatus Scalindua sp.]